MHDAGTYDVKLRGISLVSPAAPLNICSAEITIDPILTSMLCGPPWALSLVPMVTRKYNVSTQQASSKSSEKSE